MIKFLFIPILILIISCYPEPQKPIEIYRFINLSDFDIEMSRYYRQNGPTLKNHISKNNQIEIQGGISDEKFNSGGLDSIRFKFSNGKQILFRYEDRHTVSSLRNITPFNSRSFKTIYDHPRKGPRYLEYTIDKKIYDLAK